MSESISSYYSAFASWISRDGNVLVFIGLAADESLNEMYVSTDRGLSWTKADKKSGSWASVALSEDGTVIYAGEAGRLWKSTNYGVSWTELQPDGAADKNWTALACDADGTVVMASDSGSGNLWLSTNSGAAWAACTPDGVGGVLYALLLADEDGSVLVVGVDSGRLYVSTNTGGAWAEKQPNGAVDYAWYYGAISRNGTKIIAAALGDRAWSSVNTGTAWTELTPTGVGVNANWGGVSMSNDGVTMVLCENTSEPSLGYGGRIYKSTDSGANFTEIYPLGDTYQAWGFGGMDDDATIITYTVNVGLMNTGSGMFIVYSVDRIEPGRLPLFSNIQPGAVPMANEDGSKVLGAKGWTPNTGYTIIGSCTNQATTTDSQTLYWGAFHDQAATTSAGVRRMYIPKNGRIKAIWVYMNAGTAGSNENWSLYIVGSGFAAELIQTLASNSANRVWTNIALDIVVYSGDYIEFKEIQPAWGTNPANVRRWGIVYIE
jgi:photosystem II stability/assembly factor-like uncharacterized protein